MEEHLEQEDYRIPRSEGKAHFLSDIFVKELIPKPYMYADRLRGQTLKKKLENRESLEYINAFMSMLRDKRVGPSAVRDLMFAHLHDVTQDALNRPWADVRLWSQRVFDAIERGDYRWGHVQEIQNERFRLALPVLRGHSLGQANGTSTQGNAKEVLCVVFNSDKGCSAVVTGYKEKAYHMEGSIKCAHICMYCMASASQRQPHSVTACYRKERHRMGGQAHAHSGNHSNTNRFSGTQGFPTQLTAPAPCPNHYQLPKNGQYASQPPSPSWPLDIR